MNATAFHVDSEVGRLRQVILHRPGLELSRLTPRNVDALLFDDILWAKRAREEHDAFAQVLRDHGARVHYFADLLAQTLADPEARDWLLERVITPATVGPALMDPLRELCVDLDGETLAGHLIGGILKSDLTLPTPHSLVWNTLDAEDFALTPLPNHLFPRDNSCWMYDRLSVNPMAKRARRRESLHAEAIYRFHPMFAGTVTTPLLDGAVGTLEGGDVHVLGNGAVMVGMGERTTAQAVENLASRLFATGTANRLLAVQLPAARAYMHLDTVLTMVDHDAFTVYPGLADSCAPGPSHPATPARPASRSPRTPTWPAPWPRHSTWTRSGCCPRRRTSAAPSASSGTTAATSSPSRRVSSSATSATSPPTPTSASRASRSSPSPAPNSAAAGADRAA